ncbi:hypothetical protein CS053_15235 [Rhodanobacter glycinis]|uniref:TubC N-terminal docking domain-containing protein n=1 Tax=Rhodanobacter glycinis TaxID=582702 RepID=A0A5B9E3Z3_9GAMM|nr:hypothetical protein [Rhodanobacter glycinis]QEE25705.1 hypothetical protein CS053_15235 [Rhodanobacter glycinis]
MSAVALIRQCNDAGIRLQARGDRLHIVAPAGTVTPELRQRLAEYKADVLALHAIRSRLLALAGTLGIPRRVIDALPAEGLEATAQQVAACEGLKDGHGDPLPHALLVFYLKELARRVAT